MNEVAVVVFDTDLHEVSTPGTRTSLVVPGATNEQVAELLDKGGVSVWNDWYITKAIRVLREAGLEPLEVKGLVLVHPHDAPEVYKGTEEELAGGTAEEGEEDEE